MPAYSFQKQFVPMVEDGSKPHTIRARRRKGFAKENDTLYLYYGMRTKSCRLIKKEECVTVRTIRIGKEAVVGLYSSRISDAQNQELIAWGWINELNENLLSRKEADLLAWNDGFRPEGSSWENPAGSFDMMYEWFDRTHGLPFVGDFIIWKPNEWRLIAPYL